MKHKLLTVLLTFIAALCLCFALVGCDFGNSGNSGSGSGSTGGGSTTEQGGNGGTTKPDEHIHSFTNYVYNNDATCTEDGTETATCTCGESDTRVKPNTKGHTFTVENVCGRCGEEWKFTEGLKYELDINTNTYKVSGIGTASGGIVIPYGYNGQAVTSIGKMAFYNCNRLTSIVIPDSVTSIEANAFSICGLTSIEIPNSVTSIGSNAFYNCGLTSIVIPDSVTSIGGNMFRDCRRLTSIEIPDSVTEIGDGAFYRTAYYNDASKWDESGVLYIGNHLIEAKDTISGDYTIRQGTKTIAGGAFKGCSGLTSITIPDSVTSIGSYAFSGTAYYNDAAHWDSDGVLYIGNHLIEAKDTISGDYTIRLGTKTIAGGAFKGCSGLTGITIPDSVTSIGSSAFSDCSGLTSITIPDSVTYIGAFAFYYCSGLTSINIPDGVTSIGKGAFDGCSGLTSVTIGSGVTSIGDYAFSVCGKLTDIQYKGTVKEWQAIDKGIDWDSTGEDYTITCTDGTIDKQGNVTYFEE